MIRTRRTGTILPVILLLALIMSIAFAMVGSAQETGAGLATEPEYATKIFGPDIISIEIIADETSWQWMLDNAMDEEFIKVDVIVNGTKFKDVGIRPKGNSSLAQVANSGSDRFSFRLQFDEYVKGQTCFGLDSFVVNNMIGDSTYMKEYVSYELMREIGVAAPYFGYADIRVNGKSWGFYLAVERYSKSYKKRVFGDTLGMLYNVKTMDIAGNDGQGQPNQQWGNIPALPDGQTMTVQNPDGTTQQIPIPQQNPQTGAFNPPFQMPGGEAKRNLTPPTGMAGSAFPPQMEGAFNGANRTLGGMGGRGSSGGSLEYIDDSTESYSAIFDNVVGKGTETDFLRVVQALKALSKGEELETYFDIDQILRYLAAHTIVVNLDSYSSSMAQNYFIYERDGQLTILPWDYNLAWGGFQSGGTSSVINFPIDTPVSGVDMSSRPLLEMLFANTEYLKKYHSYLQQLIDTYFASGKFKEKIETLDALISDYVKNDPTAFCTYDQYKTAVSAFITLGNLRAQSVQGQLDGTVPSTTAAQSKDPNLLISAGDLKLSDLGSMMGGKGGNAGNFTGGNPR